ncbi:uncharacterized protein ACRADG_010606 isoform 4-T4 [Cochliomyia hominivorax]
MFTSSFIMPNDLSDLCRVCLQLPEESQYLDLTTIYDEEDNLTYGECFFICTQIDLNDGEGVPHQLCKTCGLELQMSYDFHKKIEESKRVIAQCQKQIQEQKATYNANDLLVSGVESNKETSPLKEEENGITHLINNNKYIISEEEMELESGPSSSASHQEQQDVMQHINEQTYENTGEINEEATNEIDIVNKMNSNDLNVGKEDHKSSLEEVNFVTTEQEEHLEVDDYQNLEALEEEECTQANEDYVEFTEEETEEAIEDDVKEDIDELDEQYADNDETNDTNVEKPLKWQNNVVAVANKEHLPIEIDDDEGDERIIYDTHVIHKESSQDESYEEEEENEKNADETLTNENSTNNGPRKRHVGSYSCDYCQRVFPNYSRMKTHRRCHETDRPKFSCSQCSRIYATKQARDSHVQTAHEKTGYTCSICNKVFAIRKSLEIHIRYHTGDFPYACKLCDRKFAQACHLNTHINVKHNKIRFSCDYPGCGKFFTSSTSLRNHEYTHGIMPFECEYCQQGYPAKAKLRIHILRKHGLELNKDQLEKMRKFHVVRSRVNLVQFVDP